MKPKNINSNIPIIIIDDEYVDFLIDIFLLFKECISLFVKSISKSRYASTISTMFNNTK